MTKGEAVAYLGLQQGTRLASTRRIPGLKCETWGTLRVLPKMYWEFRRKTADPSPSLRFGRDDKGKGDSSIESGCRTEAFFIFLGGPQAHPTLGMTKRRGWRALLRERLLMKRAVAYGEGGCL
jgi:hypothetical protein